MAKEDQEKPDSKRPAMSVGAISITGKVREENQDRMSRSQVPLGDLYIVADGMGGYKGGAAAAQFAVETIERVLKDARPDSEPGAAIRSAIQQANAEVHRQAESGEPEFKKMGSTAVVLLVVEGVAHVGYAGDSRAYLMHQGSLRQLTRDHTKVQELMDADILTPEEARDHPDASTLTRALGPKPEVAVDLVAPLPLQPGDAILLCSDGLSGYVEHDAIQQAVRQSNQVQEVAEKLVALAMETGGEDNITVQFACYGDLPVGGQRRQTRETPIPNFHRTRLIAGGVGVLVLLAAAGVFAYEKWGKEVAPPVPPQQPLGASGSVGSPEKGAQGSSSTPVPVIPQRNPPADVPPTPPPNSAPATLGAAAATGAEGRATIESLNADVKKLKAELKTLGLRVDALEKKTGGGAGGGNSGGKGTPAIKDLGLDPAEGANPPANPNPPPPKKEVLPQDQILL